MPGITKRERLARIQKQKRYTKRKTVGVDWDGTIFDVASAFELAAFVLFKRRAKLVKHCVKSIVFDPPLSEVESKRVLYEGLTLPQIQKQVGFLPGAIESIKRVIAEGDQPIIITRRSSKPLLDCLEQSLASVGLNIPFYSCGFHGVKRDLAVAHRCSVFIDDDLEQLWPMVKKVEKLFFIRHWYNRHQWDHKLGIVQDVNTHEAFRFGLYL